MFQDSEWFGHLNDRFGFLFDFFFRFYSSPFDRRNPGSFSEYQ